MARKLSREFSEFKAALGRKLSRESSKDKITIRDTDPGTLKKDKKTRRDSENRKMSGDSDNAKWTNDTKCSDDSGSAKDSKTNHDYDQSKDRRSSQNTIDTNCNIEKRKNLDTEGRKMAASKKSSSIDKTWNPGRKLSRSISNVKKFIPVLYDGIPHHIQEKARLELNETDENIQKGMTKLKAYIKKEKLPPVDDGYLMACLRVSKYEGKKAQEKLKRYYHMRLKLADSFEKLDLETVRQVLRHNMIGYLPYRDEAGRGIIFTRGVVWYPEICDFEEFVMVAYLAVFHLVSIPITTITGVRYLCDIKARSYNQYYQYYKTFKANISFATTMPVRLHFDCVHDNSASHWIFTLLRPILPPKLVKRLRLHGYSYESLQTEIDFSILPEEYGGTMGPLNSEFLMEKFEEFFLKFKAENPLFMKR